MVQAQVAIVIPCFNQGAFLAEAIQSALAQTIPCEVIVVDDGSEDGTSEVAKAFPVRLVTQKNRGTSATRNAGIAATEAEYIVCLDADDKLHRDYARTAAGKDDIVGTVVQRFGASRNVIRRSKTHPTCADFVDRNYLLSGAMFRREVWEAVGGFDESLREFEDWDFWTRATHLGFTVTNLSGRPLYFYRKHARDRSDVVGSVDRGRLRSVELTAAMRASWAKLGIPLEPVVAPEPLPRVVGRTVGKVDVVYPLTNASKGHEDFEIRYSLRSLARQDWVRNVYIVGHKPDWMKDVRHIPCGDPYPPKDANLINKVLLACADSELSDEFVVNSDDQYTMEPVTLCALGPYSDPQRIKTASRDRHSSKWSQRLLSTVSWCRKNHLPDFVLDCHMPYLVDKAEYQRVMAKVPWGAGNGVTTHVYFNLTMTEAPPEPPSGLVFHAGAPGPVPEDCTFFNHNNTGLTPQVKKWLEAKFPEPSPWET